MKCKKCNKKAVINLKSYNLPFCDEHFKNFFLEKTAETIKKYRLFTKQDVVIVAVSGGKDSLALWLALKKLGYKTHGFHINLGIKQRNYSDISEAKTVKFAEAHGLPLSIVSLNEAFGFTIDDYRKLGHRSACSTCGIIKRYLINDFTRKVNANCVATGHNLDDESAVLLGNLLNWQTGYLKRQHPKLPPSHGYFASRVKPFAERTERETAAYSLLNNIDYVQEECPYSVGASSIFYKKILNEIEERSPGTKLRFFRGFLQNKEVFDFEENKDDLVPCEFCGQPTVASPCAFCRILKRVMMQNAV